MAGAAARANTASTAAAMAPRRKLLSFDIRAFPHGRPLVGSYVGLVLICLWSCTRLELTSFRLDPRGLHQVRPHRHFAVDDGGIFLGRGRLRLGALDRQPLAHLVG